MRMPPTISSTPSTEKALAGSFKMKRRGQKRQQRPRAARERIHQRQIGNAVARLQRERIAHVQNAGHQQRQPVRRFEAAAAR